MKFCSSATVAQRGVVWTRTVVTEKKIKIKRIEFSARDIENKCANMWFSDMRHSKQVR